MRKNASLTDWVQWMAQPVRKIIKLHKEFVFGPVEDLIDDVIKAIAPELVKQLAKREVQKDVQEFERGVTAGRNDKTENKAYHPGDDDPFFLKGYSFGYKVLQKPSIPKSFRRMVIEESLDEFREEISVQVVISLLKKIWHAVNPMNTLKAILTAVKKHGWKLGIGFGLFELFEHFVLPSLLVYLFDDPRLLGLATVPIGEVVYAVGFRFLGRAPKELDKFSETGHFDWFEDQYGPVKIASLANT